MILKEEYGYPLPVQRPPSQGDKFVYIDYVNDEPFYIGMGNWERVRNPDRNDYHFRLLCNLNSKDRWIRRAVARNLGTDDAFNLEHTLILYYGRKDLGTGTLVNKNNGIGMDLRNVSFPVPSASTTYSSFPVFFSVVLFASLIIGASLIRKGDPHDSDSDVIKNNDTIHWDDAGHHFDIVPAAKGVDLLVDGKFEKNFDGKGSALIYEDHTYGSQKPKPSPTPAPDA